MRKRTNPIFLGLIALALLGSCNRNKEGYPSQPVNGQVYHDRNGNTNIWNAALGYWMISSMINGQQVQHYYYPSTGVYRDASNRVVTKPAHIPSYRTANVSRSSMTTKSGTGTSSGSKGGFGSTGSKGSMGAAS